MASALIDTASSTIIATDKLGTGTLARLQGVVLGGLLLYLDTDERFFDLESLFAADSLWAVDLTGFLLQRANLFSYDPRVVLHAIQDLASPTGLLALLVLVVLPPLLVLLCVRLWRRWDALRAVFACAAISLWSAWLTIYLVCLLLWGLHLLNVWALALLALYLQYRRARARGGE